MTYKPKKDHPWKRLTQHLRPRTGEENSYGILTNPNIPRTQGKRFTSIEPEKSSRENHILRKDQRIGFTPSSEENL